MSNAGDNIIKVSALDRSFARQVEELSGSSTSICFHCTGCSGGCPFGDIMDYHPNHINRLVQLGMKKEALESSAIWICIGCHTCSVSCPQGVDIPAIMDSLRHMALKEGVEIAEPAILNFHKEVINSIKQYGRTHKLEIMLRYKVATRSGIFDDVGVGLKMLLKRKLDLTPSRIKNTADLKKLFGNE